MSAVKVSGELSFLTGEREVGESRLFEAYHKEGHILAYHAVIQQFEESHFYQ